MPFLLCPPLHHVDDCAVLQVVDQDLAFRERAVTQNKIVDRKRDVASKKDILRSRMKILADLLLHVPHPRFALKQMQGGVQLKLLARLLRNAIDRARTNRD